MRDVSARSLGPRPATSHKRAPARRGPLRLLSVHNIVTHENIPFEVFMHLNPNLFDLSVLSLYQSQEELEHFLGENCRTEATSYGLNYRKRRLRGLAGLWRLLRKNEFDVVHVNHVLSGCLVAVLAKLISSAKIVTTLHSDFQRFRGVQKWLLAVTLRLSDMVVCNSQNTKQSLGVWKHGRLQGKKLRVCYNGVNLQEITTAAAQSRSAQQRPEAGSLVVGFVGRLAAVKDLPALLRGFARLNQARPSSRLVIVGDGPLRAELEKLAADLSLEQAVHFRGALPRKEVYRELAEMDVLVISSRFEGFCNAMVEGMAAGKAIVASDIPVLREVLGSDCGLFFSTGSCKQLGDRLTRLYDDRALRESLGHAAGRRALKEFALHACVDNYTACYLELCQTVPIQTRAA